MEETKPYRVIPSTGSAGEKDWDADVGLAREAGLFLPIHRPEFKSRYYIAPQVKDVADAVITRYHPHLKEAAIAYLLRRGNWKSKGQVVTGKALTAPEQWRYLSDCDLVLIINETVWEVLEPRGREVLLDHELSHFTPPAADKNGNLRWAIREHDLQEFSDVVKRHGICTGDHQRLIAAAGQLDLESLGALTARDGGESMGGDYDDTENDDDGFTEEDDLFGRE